jgi:2-oxoglutarate ferredoxin oxidoreductase subunit alpha
MLEGISYLAGAEVPCLIVNVVRGGPGLGTIQPSQADYLQATKGGGHGDYQIIVLTPASVQEMNDFVSLGFDLAFKYRIPALILTDGVIGQMMEKVVVDDYKPRWTDEEIKTKFGSWATTGKTADRGRNIITSLNLKPEDQEVHNDKLQAKHREIEKNEVRYEELQTEDAEYLFVAYGSSARICQKSVELAREKGIKVGLLRPITVWPFPTQRIMELSDQVKGVLTVEMSAGQMVVDVRLAVNGKVPVEHFGRYGGMVPTPDEVVVAFEKQILGGN